MVVELKVPYCRENFRIHLIPMRYFTVFFLLSETTGEQLQTTLRSYFKIVNHKMSHWSQTNPEVFLYNTTLSAQLQGVPRNMTVGE